MTKSQGRCYINTTDVVFSEHKDLRRAKSVSSFLTDIENKETKKNTRNTKMVAIKATRLTINISKNISKRVVSTSSTGKQNATYASDVTVTSTCPFRAAFETMENVITPENKNKVVPTTAEVQPFESIPGPKGLPIVGTLFEYLKKDGPKFNKMFEVYKNRAHEYGPIYKEKIATISSVVISDPNLYNHVIRAEGRYPNRREMEPMAYYRQIKNLSLGLVNAQGEEWHKFRTVVSKKMLKMKEVHEHCHDMDLVADDFIKHLSGIIDKNNEVPDLDKELFKWSMESIGTFLFEERIGCFSSPTPEFADNFMNNLLGFFKTMQPLMYNVPTYKLFKTKLWKQYEQYSDNVLKYGRTYIEKKAKDLQSHKPGEDGKVTFLSYLLSQESLSADEALTTATDLLTGATETTMNASQWALYNLAKYPDVQEALYQEVNKVLPNNEPITPELLNKLQYVRAFLKETFRLFPITFATSRNIDQDIEVAGYKIPKGTHVQANLYGMFRDPAMFPDPESFKPERWLRENSMDSNVKALSNLVWGHGARMCIGRRFAEQEIHIMLAKMVKNFKLEYHHEDIEPVLNTVMTPDRQLRITFIPRKPQP